MNLKLMSTPYLLWITIFSIVPMFFVVYYSLTDIHGNFTLENFFEIQNYSCAFLRSIIFSVVSTIISFLIGYPTAYSITKLKKKHQKMIVALIMLQMWVSFLLTTYSLMTIMESNGIINRILGIFGIDYPLINTKSAVIIGMVYNCMPYMILPIYSSLSKMDPKIIEAAKDLGADKFKIFKKITFPMSIPGVLSGILMVFAPNMSTFIVSKMLGGNENILIGEIIELKFLGVEYNPRSGSAIAISLMFFIVLCIELIRYCIYERK